MSTSRHNNDKLRRIYQPFRSHHIINNKSLNPRIAHADKISRTDFFQEFFFSLALRRIHSDLDSHRLDFIPCHILTYDSHSYAYEIIASFFIHRAIKSIKVIAKHTQIYAFEHIHCAKILRWCHLCPHYDYHYIIHFQFWLRMWFVSGVHTKSYDMTRYGHGQLLFYYLIIKSNHDENASLFSHFKIHIRKSICNCHAVSSSIHVWRGGWCVAYTI